MHNNKVTDDEKPESNEHDKWMENNEHDKDSSELNSKGHRLKDLRGRAKQFASNKYHLIIVLLCIILFILFLIVIVLAVRLGTYQCTVSVKCRTPECLQSAAALVARSNATYDPCRDFWAYSCKGWETRNPLPSNKGSYSVLDQLKVHVYGRIRRLIDLVPHGADTASHPWKVQNFYQSCMDVKNIEYWVPQKIKQTIHEIGGWAATNDPPGGNWKRNDVLKKLQVSFGVAAFFKLTVEPDDADPLKNVIKLVPDGLGLPSPAYYFKPHDDQYVRAYKNFITETIKELGGTLHEANKLADEIFHYERRLAQVTPKPEALRKTNALYTIMSVNELERLSTSILWTEILQAYFPSIVTQDTQVAVLSQNYFREISRIISSTDNTVLNNYYMWRLMYTYIPHSSSHFRLIWNHFKQTLEGVPDLNLQYEENWITCIDITSRFLGHAIGAMYTEHYFNEDLHSEIHVYLSKLQGALSSISLDLPWIRDEATRESAHSKVRSLLFLIGHPGFVRNRTLETYYQELKVQSDYFQNLKDGVYFLHKKQEEMLTKNALTDYSWTVYSQDFMVDYKYSGNQLVVPAGLFEGPLFNFGSPMAVKYGVFAAHVANKLAEMFDDKGVNYDMYGTLNPWITNNTMMAFENKLNCLRKIISDYSIDGVKVEANLTIASLIADIGGLKIAYEAYNRHREKLEMEGELPGTDVNNDQLFFISYAQSMCQVIRPEKMKAIKESNMQLPGELRVLSSLQQFPAFSEAFSCPRSSIMNSKHHCRVW